MGRTFPTVAGGQGRPTPAERHQQKPQLKPSAVSPPLTAHLESQLSQRHSGSPMATQSSLPPLTAWQRWPRPSHLLHPSLSCHHPLPRHPGRACQSFEQRLWEKSTAHRPRSTLHLLLPTSLRPSPHKAMHRRAPCTSCSLLPAHTA